MPEFDIIELSTIFESGIQAIPWEKRRLDGQNGVSFQEFQYITLGPGDTLSNVKLCNVISDDNYNKKFLDENWQYCDEVNYKVANTTGDPERLQAVNVTDRNGNGWEACATLELNVTPNVAQTLRRTDKVETSLSLSRTNAYGDDCGTYIIMPPSLAENEAISEVVVPVFFKTNVACQAAGNSINVNDLYGSNTTNSFQIRVFAPDSPTIVDVLYGSVAPYSASDIVDLATWPGDTITVNNSGDAWTRLLLSNLSAEPTEHSTGVKTEKALRLPINVLQDSYCVFCVYLDAISALDSAGSPVWIEVPPGMPSDAVVLLNSASESKLDITSNRLYLNQGINCIRVNNTCKLFIKADRGTDGLMFFDEPRLVSCQELHYKNSEGNIISLYTNGLNLTQLGYLDTSFDDSGKIDETTRAALHKAYAEKATSEITKVIQGAYQEASAEFNELAKLKTNVQAIVEAEALIASELENIKQADDTQLTDLIEQYNKVNNTLSNEIALLEALKNNVKAEELEQRIVELLNGLEATESTRNKIVEKLSALKTSINESSAEISDSLMLSDFIELANKTDLSDAFVEIQDIVIEDLEKNYQEQLATLINKLTALVSSEDKTMLMTVLEGLRAYELADIQVKLQSLTTRLSEVLEQDTINSTISDMIEAAGAANYTQLYSLITLLDGLLESRGLNSIVAELNQLMVEADDTSLARLPDLISELTAIISYMSNSDDGSINSDLNSLASAVKELIESSTDTVKPEIIDSVDGIREKFTEEFRQKLNKIVTELEECALAAEKDTAIKELNEVLDELYGSSSENSKIKIVVDRILDLIAKHKTNLDKANSMKYNTWQDSGIEDFVSSAISTVWPRYFADRLSALLAEIEAVFISTLNIEHTFEAGNDALKSLFDPEVNINLTSALLSAITVNDFMTLFDSVEFALSEHAQNIADKSLIATIGSFVKNSQELQDALENKPENSVIRTLLDDWKNADNIIKKQQLQIVLKDELVRAVRINEQVFDIVSELLWPSIHSIEATLDLNNDFYTKFATELSVAKRLILMKDFGSIALANDQDYLDLINATNFNELVISFETPEVSWLPDSFTESVDELKLMLGGICYDSDLLRDNPISSNTEKTNIEIISNSLKTNKLKVILNDFIDELDNLYATDIIEAGYEDVADILRLEKQLLADIRKMDVNKDFYYSAPVEDRLAIEFNESDKKLNTLMNPMLNYDINNVNNSFVISKLDIDYIDNGKGIQIARSSRLS